MLSHVRKYKVNGESSPDNDDEKILIDHYGLNYQMESQDLYENFNYADFGALTDSLGDVNNNGFIHYATNTADPILASGTHLKQNVYTLENIKKLPVGHYDDTVLVNNGNIDTIQTDFRYDWFGGNIEKQWYVRIDSLDSTVVVDSISRNPGRKGRLLTKIIDPLGGETDIVYYPENSKTTLYNAKGNNKPKGCALLNPDASYAIVSSFCCSSIG